MTVKIWSPWFKHQHEWKLTHSTKLGSDKYLEKSRSLVVFNVLMVKVRVSEGKTSTHPLPSLFGLYCIALFVYGHSFGARVCFVKWHANSNVPLLAVKWSLENSIRKQGFKIFYLIRSAQNNCIIIYNCLFWSLTSGIEIAKLKCVVKMHKATGYSKKSYLGFCTLCYFGEAKALSIIQAF